MTKRWDRDRFKIVSRQVGDGYQRVYQIFCWECDGGGEIIDGTRSGMPPEMVAKKFAVLGWDVGPNAGRDHCPSCVDRKPEPKVIAMKADPPRIPTRGDRRRIIDALEEHYDAARERYKSSWTDKGLSHKLDLPVAWVAEERERAYGPDVNEQAAKRTHETQAIRAEMEQVQTQLLAQFDALEARLKQLEADTSYKGAA